jgi:hypothetical protein
LSIQKDIDETYIRLEKILNKANTRVDYTQRFILKRFIRLNNQIKNTPQTKAIKSKSRAISQAIYQVYNLIDTEMAEDYKTRIDQFTSAPAKKLEVELDKANRIIDNIEWKQIYPFYKDSKELGLIQANTKWKPKMLQHASFVKRVYENNSDEQKK